MKPLLLTLNLLLGADATTTHYALNHGAHEFMLSQNPVVNDVILAGQAVGVSYELQWLNKKHPKIAKVLGWSFVGVRGAIVVNNLRQIQKLR